MLRTRVLTAVVLVALLAACALLSPWALSGLCAVFLGLTLFEWLRLAPLAAPTAALLAAAAALAGWVCDVAGWLPQAGALAVGCALAVAAWLVVGGLLVRAQRAGLVLPRGAVLAAAPLLCAAAWFALLALLHVGPIWTLSVLALVWLADIAAYFAGRAFGRRKLADRISPGKTWAGVVGALVAVLALAQAVAAAWPGTPLWSTVVLQRLPLAGPLVLAVLVGLSIVGDLFESLVKRRAGVKDSGRALPGHGGAWDRLDACLPVLPLAVLVQGLLRAGVTHG